MHETFWIADTHFGHEGVCTRFKRPDGSPLRPFACADEMDEALVKNWNSVVGEFDRVYLLGDVAMARKNVRTLGRLRGKIRLVKGNHDLFKLKDYLPYVDDILGVAVRDELIASHIPIHPSSLARWSTGNVHGHLHAGRVMRIKPHTRKVEEVDPRYLNVSVEQIDYTPITTAEVKRRLEEQAQ